MKSILERIQAMERELPSMVTVIYPNGTQTAVEALRAFEIAVHNREVTYSLPPAIKPWRAFCEPWRMPSQMKLEKIILK